MPTVKPERTGGPSYGWPRRCSTPPTLRWWPCLTRSRSRMATVRQRFAWRWRAGRLETHDALHQGRRGLRGDLLRDHGDPAGHLHRGRLPDLAEQPEHDTADAAADRS